MLSHYTNNECLSAMVQIFFSEKMKCSIQQGEQRGEAVLNGTFHLSLNENIPLHE